MKQRVDQSPIEIARRGMDDQARWLVDHKQMLVLEHDGQRNVLRLVVRRRGFRNRDPELLVAFDLDCRVTDSRTFGLDRAAANQSLETLARKRRDSRGERTVEP